MLSFPGFIVKVRVRLVIATLDVQIDGITTEVVKSENGIALTRRKLYAVLGRLKDRLTCIGKRVHHAVDDPCGSLVLVAV